jgi:hypothetical protein
MRHASAPEIDAVAAVLGEAFSVIRYKIDTKRPIAVAVSKWSI